MTGSTGFIGSHLVSRLKQEGIEPKLFDRKLYSLEDKNSLVEFVRDCDTVFHLAAINDPSDPEVFKVNVLGTANLLDVVKTAGANPKVIFTSTIGVYKPPEKGRIVDEMYEISPRNRYTLSKLLCEELFKYSSRVESVNSVILRLSNVYGPGDRVGRSVTSNFLDAAKKGSPLILYGSGDQTRDFVFIDDVIEALLLAASTDLDMNPSVINICSGEETSIKKLASLVKEISEKKVNIVQKDPNVSGGGFWRGSNELAHKLLNWTPAVSLEEGLKLTYRNI